jgi:glycyl-tRNA synthetase beta chain
MLDRNYESALRDLLRLRPPLNAFFDAVTVNHPEPLLRANRLKLLNAVVSLMNSVADFSKIEG